MSRRRGPTKTSVTDPSVVLIVPHEPVSWSCAHRVVSVASNESCLVETPVVRILVAGASASPVPPPSTKTLGSNTYNGAVGLTGVPTRDLGAR